MKDTKEQLKLKELIKRKGNFKGRYFKELTFKEFEKLDQFAAELFDYTENRKVYLVLNEDYICLFEDEGEQKEIFCELIEDHPDEILKNYINLLIKN